MFNNRFKMPISGIWKINRLCPNAICILEGKATSDFLRFTRKKVADFANSNTLNAEDTNSLIIAVGEAATNAIKYGDSKKPIRIKMENISGFLRITIKNSGKRFRPPSRNYECIDFVSEHGRGIICMRALMDDVIIKSGIFGTKVKLIKRIGKISTNKENE